MVNRRYALTYWLPLILGFLFAACNFFWSLAWVNRSYAGFLLERYHGAYPSVTSRGNGLAAGLPDGALIVEYDHRPLTDNKDLYRYVESRPVGTPIQYGIKTASGSRSLTIRTQIFETVDWINLFLITWIVGVVHFAIGAIVLAKKPNDSAAWAHWYFCLAMGMFLVAFLDLDTDYHLLNVPLGIAECMVGFTGLNLAWQLPRRWPLVQRYAGLLRWCLPVGMIVSTGLIINCVLRRTGGAAILISGLASIGALTIPASAVWSWLSRHSSPNESRQARIILLGSTLAFLPTVIFRYVNDFTEQILGNVATGLFFIGIFPISIAYAILRYRLFDIQVVLRTAAVYSALVGCLGALYVACATTAANLLNPWLSLHAGVRLSGLLATLVVAGTFQPLLMFLRTRLDRVFLGERPNPLKLLADFPPPVATSPRDLAESLVDLIHRQLGAAWVRIRLDDGTTINKGNVPSFADTIVDVPEMNRTTFLQELVPEADELTLVISMATAGDKVGTVQIGPRPSAIPYETDVRAMLGVLATQTAVAMQGARLLQDRVSLLVKAETAKTQSQERERVITAVVSAIRSDIRVIEVSTTQYQQTPGDPAALQAIRQRLEHIEGYLDETTLWVKGAPDPTTGPPTRHVEGSA